jgi:hypothetical protein
MSVPTDPNSNLSLSRLSILRQSTATADQAGRSLWQWQSIVVSLERILKNQEYKRHPYALCTIIIAPVIYHWHTYIDHTSVSQMRLHLSSPSGTLSDSGSGRSIRALSCHLNVTRCRDQQFKRSIQSSDVMQLHNPSFVNVQPRDYTLPQAKLGLRGS